jgi:hypothetical protein
MNKPDLLGNLRDLPKAKSTVTKTGERDIHTEKAL